MTDDPRPDGAPPAGETGAAVPDGASGESAPPRRHFLAEAPARLRFLNIAAALGLVALLFFVLVVGRDFLVPFIVAVAIWYLMIALKESFKQSRKYTRVPVPDAIATVLAIATTILAITLIVVLVNSSINGVIASIPKYQDRINDIIGNSLKLVGYEGENPLREFIANLRPQEYVSRAAGAIGGLVQDMGLIIVYVLFLLLETLDLPAQAERAGPVRQPPREPALDDPGDRRGHQHLHADQDLAVGGGGGAVLCGDEAGRRRFRRVLGGPVLPVQLYPDHRRDPGRGLSRHPDDRAVHQRAIDRYRLSPC